MRFGWSIFQDADGLWHGCVVSDTQDFMGPVEDRLSIEETSVAFIYRASAERWGKTRAEELMAEHAAKKVDVDEVNWVEVPND